MNIVKTMILAAFVGGGAVVAQAQPPVDAEIVRNCARTACSDFRSCTTGVGTLSVQKSGQGTQSVSDCRAGIADTYASCAGQLPQRVKSSNTNKKNGKAASVTVPNSRNATVRSANTTPKR